MNPDLQFYANLVLADLAEGPASRSDIEHRHGDPSSSRWWWNLVDAMVADGQAVELCDHSDGSDHHLYCPVGLLA